MNSSLKQIRAWLQVDARSVIVIYNTWNYEKILSFVEDR